MKKKLAKIVTLALVLSMVFSGTALAAQSYTKDYSASIYKEYWDTLNVKHVLSGSATCRGTIEWDEGLAGWILSAHFDTPSATVDGKANTASFSSSGSTVISASTAYQNYRVNETSHIVHCVLSCNEYGDSSFSAYCN